MSLPVTWRPRRSRRMAAVLAGVIIVTMVTLAIVIAPPFGLADRIGLVLFGLAIAGLLYLLGRCRVTADAAGLTLVNPLRTLRYEWAEVIRVNMGDGEPWPTLDLADGSTVSAIGIQRSDGDRARQALAELRALLHERGEAPDP
ncbi:MAG TPA: PH domain-containing protein [Streptosporangiaceae bacterium]